MVWCDQKVYIFIYIYASLVTSRVSMYCEYATFIGLTHIMVASTPTLQAHTQFVPTHILVAPTHSLPPRFSKTMEGQTTKQCIHSFLVQNHIQYRFFGSFSVEGRANGIQCFPSVFSPKQNSLFLFLSTRFATTCSWGCLLVVVLKVAITC